MSDDLGRGMLGWSAERWQSLDSLAAEAMTGSVVMRNLVKNSDEPDKHNVRMAGKDVPVTRINEDFDFNMQDENEEDLERKIQLAAESLALAEDKAVINVMDLKKPLESSSLDYDALITAKKELIKRNVQRGFGVVVSADMKADLEKDVIGNQIGLQAANNAFQTTLVESNALPFVPDIHAVLFQSSPAAHQMARAYGPRIRVMSVKGEEVKLRLEEGIAIGELTAGRTLGLKHVPKASRP